MEDIDLIRINFNADQLKLLNFCLAILMFGIALEIKLSDFVQLLKKPKVSLLGLVSQYILLPALTSLLIYLIQPRPSLALGMLLLAVCPGGSVSNFMVHLSSGTTVLSIILTSVTTVSAVLITPIYFNFLVDLTPSVSDMATSFSVNVADMIVTIFQLLAVPLALGIYLNEKHPNLTKKLRRPTKILSLLIFFSFVVFALKGNAEYLSTQLTDVFLIVLVHNGLAFAVGYFFAKLNKVSESDARAISIETGIQNSGLALIIVFNFFDGLGGMAIIVAWWGIWHLMSGFCLAMFWRREMREVRQEA